MTNNDAMTGYAALLLRVSSGILFLAHATAKVQMMGFSGTAGFFQMLGLPGPLAYLVILMEVVGGVALILGLQTRIVAIVLGVELLCAAWFGHSQNGWLFMNKNGGWEYPVYWAITMFALAGLGDGALALGKRGADA